MLSSTARFALQRAKGNSRGLATLINHSALGAAAVARHASSITSGTAPRYKMSKSMLSATALLGPLPLHINQSLETTMEEHYAANNMQEVVRLYSGLVASGFTPTLHQTAICCATCLSTKQTQRAVPLMDSLLQEGHKPSIDHIGAWAFAYHEEQRMDSACDLLQDAVARNPAFALQRVGLLCIMHFSDNDINQLAALCREGRLIDLEELERARRHCSTAGDNKLTHALGLAICGGAEQALAAFQERGLELNAITDALLLLSSCLAVEQDLKQSLASVLDALGEAPLNMRYAWRIALTCAAYDRNVLQQVLSALDALKAGGEVELTQQMCSLAIAAAHELEDADAAVMWFDAMQQRGLLCDQLLYYLVASACCSSRNRFYEVPRVLSAAEAAGVMTVLAEPHSAAVLEVLRRLQRSAEPIIACLVEHRQLMMQLLFTRSNYRAADMTDQSWCHDIDWDLHGGPAIAAAAAVRLFLTDAAQQQPAHQFIKLADVLQSAAVPVASGLTVDNNDEVCIKFTTGSAIGCAVAKELHAELKSGAVSNISIDVDGATTYTVTVPGLQSYFASWRRDPTANSMRA
eukprot:11730-Heterococcus_DN1.PRE.2